MLRRFLLTKALLILCLVVSFPSKSSALGDPLTNMGLFFEHIFRVHFDSPISINNAYRMFPDEGIQINKRDLAVKRSETDLSRWRPLACADIALRSQDGWKAEKDLAIRTTEIWKLSKDKNKRPPKEAYIIKYSEWNTPAFAHVYRRRSSLLGNLRKARVSVAVLGEDFDVSLVWDEKTADLTTDTINLVKAVRSFGYEGLYDVQIGPKEISVIKKLSCPDGFSIFNFAIK